MNARYRILLILAATMPGIWSTVHAGPGGGVIHVTRSVLSDGAGTGRTFIYYPPFDPSMVDIEVYGDKQYHWPDLSIDLTVDMLNLDRVIFELDANVSCPITALPRFEDPEAMYEYLFHLDIEIEPPRGDHAFAAGKNQMIQPGVGPGGQAMVRRINMKFDIDEIRELTGVIPMSLEGFDAPMNPFVSTQRSNFILRPELGLEPHYFYIRQNFSEDTHKPHDAVVYCLHVTLSGAILIDYHFSLNYDAIDHAILFDQFHCPDIGWDVSETGTVTLMNDAIRLTTQSPVSISRTVATPEWPLLMMFDHGFRTETGTLEVRLDGHLLYDVNAGNHPTNEMRHQRVLIVDRELLGRDNLDLVFSLNGPAGSQVVLDNIGIYPFLQWQPPTLDSVADYHDHDESSDHPIAIESELPWNAQTDDDWITITQGASGMGDGTVIYSIAAYPANGARTGTITIQGGGIERHYHVRQGIPVNYEQWRDFHFPDDPHHGEPDMDYSGNGVVNLLEYALGGNPRVSATGHLPKPATRFVDDELRFAVSFPLNVYAEDLILRVQTSQDLEQWDTIGTISDAHSNPDLKGDGHTEAMIFYLQEPLHSQSSGFLRLKALLTAE